MSVIRFEKDVHRALWGHEEWLVCAHPSAPGKIVGGEGKTLRDVCPGFPLLVKKICAKDRLSVQVHPNDETAKTVGGEPKTEMWCVLESGPIFAGFRPGVTKQDVERAVADGTFEELLVRFDAKRGECYFIPGGLVHAIGEGTSVYEVQQSSDTTFRLYDWGRVGADGRPRQLHVKEGLAAMDIALPPPVPGEAVKCAYFEFYTGNRERGTGNREQGDVLEGRVRPQGGRLSPSAAGRRGRGSVRRLGDGRAFLALPPVADRHCRQHRPPIFWYNYANEIVCLDCDGNCGLRGVRGEAAR